MELARHLELEAAIVERPTDPSRYAVYGDWLTQQGDPRGPLMVAGAELATLGDSSRAVDLRRSIDALWRERRDAIAGTLAGLAQHGLTLTWRMGAVYAAALVVPPDDAGAATIGHLLAHPAAFAPVQIDVGTEALGEHGFNHQPIVDLIAEECPRSLRTLSLGTLDGWSDDETVVLGDLRPLFGRHVQLTALTLAGRASTASAPWAMPALRSLSLRPVGLSRTWLRVINAEPWPSLRSLAFSYASALDTDISWLCSSRLPQRFPRLSRLGVQGTGDALAVIDALGATGLSRQLGELDLAWSGFGAEAAERLIADREDFPRLQTLVLEHGIRGLAEIREALGWLEVRVH